MQRPQPDASRTACELKHHGITPGRVACRREKPGLRSTTEPAIKSLTRGKKDPRNPTKQPGHPNPQGKSQQPSRRDQRRETAQTQRQESQNENEQDGHAGQAEARQPEEPPNPKRKGESLRGCRCHRPIAGSHRQPRPATNNPHSSTESTKRRRSGKPARTRCKATWARVMPSSDAARVRKASTPAGSERFNRVRSEPIGDPSVISDGRDVF